MKTKIIMDNGKEYIYNGSMKEVMDRCVNVNNLPMGGTAKTFINGFVGLVFDAMINPSHISSLEEIRDIND